MLPASRLTGPPGPSRVCVPVCFRIEMPPALGRVGSTGSADRITELDLQESAVPPRPAGGRGHLLAAPARSVGSTPDRPAAFRRGRARPVAPGRPRRLAVGGGVR